MIWPLAACYTDVNSFLKSDIQKQHCFDLCRMTLHSHYNSKISRAPAALPMNQAVQKSTGLLVRSLLRLPQHKLHASPGNTASSVTASSLIPTFTFSSSIPTGDGWPTLIAWLLQYTPHNAQGDLNRWVSKMKERTWTSVVVLSKDTED